MENGTTFKNNLKVKTSSSKHTGNDKLFFERVYSSLLDYLRTLDFNDLLSNHKNKSLSEEEAYRIEKENLLKFIKIEHYIKLLSKPQYRVYLNNKPIPNRSSKPYVSNSEDNSKSELQPDYEREEKNIRLMYFIRELVNQYIIYDDPNIRNYYINLCSFILLSYKNSHPLEETTIHFRFKSPKGLIEKLAKNIILNGTFERNPETGTDVFHFKQTSDAFGAKIISKRGYNPERSLEPDEKELIKKRNKNLHAKKRYDVFLQKINSPEKYPVTYRAYYNKCIIILKRLKKLIDKKETQYISYLNERISYLKQKKKELGKNIDTVITDFDEFKTDNTDFKSFHQMYSERILTPLAITGLNKDINKILFSKSSIPITQTFKVVNCDDKKTDSGHEAIHYDIDTPFGRIELQLQTEPQYILDRNGPTSAHMLMNNKFILMPDPPTEYSSPDEFINPEDTCKFKDRIIETKNSNGTIIYFDKAQVEMYKTIIDLITAKKGRIAYNNVSHNVISQFYETLTNLETLVTELPETHPMFATHISEIKKLRNKPDGIRKLIFSHMDPFSINIAFSDILNYMPISIADVSEECYR